MKFSIVIPNYNGARLLKKNLPKVITAAKNAEIIVVDDASTDDSVHVMKEDFPQVRLIENPKNLRFAKACNTGVKQAKGEIVVLLNTDVHPEESFLKPLAPHFNDARVFAVGCMEIVNSKTRGKSTGRFEKGLLVHGEASDRKPGPTLWAFGGSAAFSREKWLQLDGMDHLFRPAYWEDIDLSYRAWKRGWEVRFEPESRVHHEPESTNVDAFGEARIRRIASKNQLLFVWKNIHDRKYILQHLLWLPLRLGGAVLKGDSAFVIGTFQAVFQFPEALLARIREKRHAKVSDENVFSKVKGTQ